MTKFEFTVTVCMPVYNGEQFLRGAFACLASQTLQGFELIVVDDGSKDGSAALAEELLKQHGLMGKVVSSANQGCEQARDLCIRHASAPLIATFDCDDHWLPDYLEEMCAALLADDSIALVYCDFEEEFTDTGQKIRKSCTTPWIDRSLATNSGVRYTYGPGVFFELLLQGQVLFPPCTVFRKEAYEQVGGYSSKLPHLRVSLDWDFGLRMSRAHAIAYVDRPLLKKSRHGANTSGNVRTTALSDLTVLERVLADSDLTPAQRDHARRRASIRALDAAYVDWSDGRSREARRCIIKSLRHSPSIRAMTLLTYSFLPSPISAAVRSLKRRMSVEASPS